LIDVEGYESRADEETFKGMMGLPITRFLPNGIWAGFDNFAMDINYYGSTTN